MAEDMTYMTQHIIYNKDQNNNIMNYLKPLRLVAAMALVPLMTSLDNDHNRLPGLYPGSPQENFAPRMVKDNVYRNIALRRASRASSTYDYNLTAQLITDGITIKTPPAYLTATTNNGPLPKREREWAIDGGEYTRNILTGSTAWLNYQWHGMTVRTDRIKLVCTMAHRPDATGGYTITVSTLLKNGKRAIIGRQKGNDMPGEATRIKAHSDPNKVTADDATLPVRMIDTNILIDNGGQPLDNIKVEMAMKGAAHWTVTEIKFFDHDRYVSDVLPSSAFTSAWMSAGGGEQWVETDLGTEASFDKVILNWLEKPAAGRIETSRDGHTWTTVAALQRNASLTDEISFPLNSARYVRVMMLRPGATGRYVLSEMKVMGRGGLSPQPIDVVGARDGKYMLDGGRWRLQRTSEVIGQSSDISTAGYDDSRWAVATVPGTALMSYVNIGALPDPNHADNMMQISESFFNSDFWYRSEFQMPDGMEGKHVFLNMDGINWKANIYVNGRQVDRIEGAFQRGRADITGMLHRGTNAIAVQIIKNEHPGAVKEKYRNDTDFNGGLLGYDNPTFHATIGWDWISTIRGRNIGIWNDVYLTAEGKVGLSDPLLTSRLALPDTTATMTPAVWVSNNTIQCLTGTLTGWIGDIRFEKNIVVQPMAETEVTFDPAEYPQLRDRKMQLWWPNGYGSPYLYDAGFEFKIGGKVSDAVSYKAGIRQVDCHDIDSRLTMYVNGRRFVPKGGNWGFSENNLCYRGREYDIAVKYHRDMNFNMIRNWVGQTGDEEFYEACDRHGIMVWQDFWLANPADGPDPLNEYMFACNARDYTLRIRNHPCIGIYCGRNEGYPPASLNKQLQEYVETLHPGLTYIPSSADDGVSGHGPYWALPAKEYFERQTGKLHSERGMPNVMTYEGLSRTLDSKALWPQGDEWGQHDYCQKGAQRGASFNEIIEKAFGKVDNARDFTALAQWVNYDGYRAMFESGSRDRMGLLIWMSHACWPSMTWQCYDYYFEPTAAFFGCKKACEPLHIQWNASTRDVEMVNVSGGRHDNVKAVREILDIHGNTVKRDEQTLSFDNDTTVVIDGLNVAERYDMNGNNVFFVRLTLTDNAGEALSDNFYVSSNIEGDLKDLKNLPTADIKYSIHTSDECLKIDLTNSSQTPAMMIRLNLKAEDGEQILPVDYSDNYFHLMPGEKKSVTIGWNRKDIRNSRAEVEMSGMNVKKILLK